METLDLVKSIVTTTSYLIVISVFVVEKSTVVRKYKIFRLMGYFLILLTVHITLTLTDFEIYINYVFLVITCLFIYQLVSDRKGANSIRNRYDLRSYFYTKGSSFIKCLNIALTIVVAFGWVIIFTGSLAFALFSGGIPHDSLTNQVIYVIALSIAHIGMAFALRKYSHKIFRLGISNKLALIDIGAKAFFIAFFNLFFPRYFEVLGMANYAALSLVLLIIVAIFVAYREYSISLENQLVVSKNNVMATLKWAKQMNHRYRELLVGGGYGNSNSNDEGCNNKQHKMETSIQNINNSVIQALMSELVMISNQLGIEIDIKVENPISNDLSLDAYSLFAIVNGFIDNAISETEEQAEKFIEVTIDTGTNGVSNKSGLWLMIKTHINAETLSKVKIDKDAIINRIKGNPNVLISVVLQDDFVQVLDVI